MNLLGFTNGNAKLDKGISILSLPAGHSCPGANLCKSQLVKTLSNSNGYGIKDGPNCQFRCFAAINEVLFPSTRKQRWNNFELLRKCKSVKEMTDLIISSLPPSKFNLPVRIHVSGDFFNQMYFDAWLNVAKIFPKRVFYGYTKSLPFLVKRLNQIPSNFRLVASYGGKFDYLIKKYKLRYAKVVFTIEEAKTLGLKIDHDDSLCFDGKDSFALLIHGQQPAGSPMAKAWRKLIGQGLAGYGKQKLVRGQKVKASYFS